MIESKEELIKRIVEILSQKSFTEKAKSNLLRSIVFAFESYNPPKYITKSRAEYIEEYLEVLENMNGYAVLELSELNDENEASTFFRNQIKLANGRTGTLDVVAGKYVPSDNGKYYCSCNGFAWNKEAMMFTLRGKDPIDEMETIHHEMTHLGEGRSPFPIATIPFSFEIRKMLYEGRATTRESYIHIPNQFAQIAVVENEKESYKVSSDNSYPLYGYLYQMMQLLFGDDVLEELAKNDNTKRDMIEELKNKYPNIPVEEVFGHVIYILSCESREKHDTLAPSIQNFMKTNTSEIEYINGEIARIQNYLDRDNSSLEMMKTDEQNTTKILNDPVKLKEQYEQAFLEEKRTIESLYKDGTYSEEEYKRELSSLEKEGTLEYYRETVQQRLVYFKDNQESLQTKIEEEKEKLKKLLLDKARVEQNHFPIILESICLKNPSLATSFTFLRDVTLKRIQEEASVKSKDDPIILDKVRVLLDLAMKIQSLENEKRTSLVS